jgi:succinate dehydrogenase / fumarate reductase membrane anchor subunit
MNSIRTPLAGARGMGASKHGVGHFIAQRITAIALILLVSWAIVSSIDIARGDYDTVATWLRNPINAALASLTAVAAFWHMQLGMRTIIEDYLAKPGTKGAFLVLNVFVTWLGGALTVLALLKVAFSPAGVNI